MTEADRSALVREMMTSDEDFQKLHDEHQQCEARLEELNHQSLLSQADEIEEKRIKLHKLALKDRMEHLLRSQAPVAATA